MPSDVIYKLLGFTAAMFALPIGMYFVSVNAIFGGKTRLLSPELTCNILTRTQEMLHLLESLRQ